MTNSSEQHQPIQPSLSEPVPIPNSEAGGKASPKELLKRLKWGEPALSIIDVRNREDFNAERITGAIPMPMGSIPESVESTLEFGRDIYVYGDSSDSTAEAANQLRAAGFRNVAELQDGLAGWKAIGGPVEGVYAWSSPKAAEEASASGL